MSSTSSTVAAAAQPAVEESEGRLRDVAADPDRVHRLIEGFAALTEAPEAPGVTRIAFTPLERRAHQVFADHMTALGLRVWTDEIGNTYAERAGRAPGRAVGTGSHLDSVPQGGRFDGIVGVVGAMEVARLLVEHDIAHDHPLRFVVFSCEEGARFGQACVGSKAAAGAWSPDTLASTKDADGVSIADAMRALDLDPDRIADVEWSKDDWGAWLELHIEQGQLLEPPDLPIGLVDLISGSTRFRLEFAGSASHTGSTPMTLRQDALAAASEVVLIAEHIANDPQHRGTRCTIGKLEVAPGSITTIPGAVTAWVDVRDIDSRRQRDTANEIVRRARQVCERRGVQLRVRLLSDASPAVIPAWVRDITAGVCRDLGLPYRVMYSGASHDSQMIARIVPVGMIFVPSRAGLSHVPQEWTSPQQIATGVDVLLRSLLGLDARLTAGGR